MSERKILSAHIERAPSCHTNELWVWELKVKANDGYTYTTPLRDRMGSNLMNHAEAQEAAEDHLDLNYQNWREEVPSE